MLHHHCQGLPCCSTALPLPLSRKALTVVAGIIRPHRVPIGSCWRKLNPGEQALLVLAYLRRGETFAELPAGSRVGTATAWRYVNATVALLAARAPKLRRATRDGKKARVRLRGGGRDPDPHLSRTPASSGKQSSRSCRPRCSPIRRLPPLVRPSRTCKPRGGATWPPPARTATPPTAGQWRTRQVSRRSSPTPTPACCSGPTSSARKPSILIQSLIQAMCLGNTVEEIGSGVLYIHPALTEVIQQALLEL